MKTVVKVIVWALLSIMLQAGVLLYLDKAYFKETSDVQVTQVEQPVSKTKDIDIKIPSDAQNVTASFDGKFISFTQGGSLKVIDTNSATIKDIKPSEGAEMLYNVWAPRSNVMLIAEKRNNQSNDKPGIYLSGYNVKSDTRNDFKTDDNTLIKVCNYTEDTKVVSLASSYQTGVTYVCVSNSGKRPVVYRIDTNGAVASIGNKVSEIEQMRAYQHLDILIYKDAVTGNLYKYTNGSIEKINTTMYKDGVTVLGLTNDNLMVLGIFNSEKKISTVISGKLGTDMNTWTKYDFDKPRDTKDIFINENGEILVNDSLLGKVINTKSKDEVSYEGKLISVTESIVVSSDDGKVYLKSLKDVDGSDS